jgi:hypothetical protein
VGDEEGEVWVVWIRLVSIQVQEKTWEEKKDHFHHR